MGLASLAAFLSLALFASVNAETAPPAIAVTLQNSQPPNTFTACLAAPSDDPNTPVEVVSCSSTARSQYGWSVVGGGSATGAGPASQIRIYGNMCLDNTNGVTTNGNLLQIYPCTDGNTNQLWTVNSDSTIKLAGTNKCVDLTNGVLAPGTPVQLWDCATGNTNQQWVPQIAPTIRSLISWQGSGSATQLCISGPIQELVGPITIQACTNDFEEFSQWNLSPSGYGPIALPGFGEGAPEVCIDVTNGVDADGTKLQAVECVDTTQAFAYVPDKVTSIQWAGSDKCIDLTNGNTTSGNVLQVWTCIDGSNNQIWEAESSF